eukprot:7579386-Pyramimonas_sp.AAC.1
MFALSFCRSDTQVRNRGARAAPSVPTAPSAMTPSPLKSGSLGSRATAISSMTTRLARSSNEA